MDTAEWYELDIITASQMHSQNFITSVRSKSLRGLLDICTLMVSLQWLGICGDDL